jgi:hypothetical protein
MQVLSESSSLLSKSCVTLLQELLINLCSLRFNKLLRLKLEVHPLEFLLVLLLFLDQILAILIRVVAIINP